MVKTTKCPNCGQEIPEDNLRCYFCGSMLDISVGPLSFIANRKGGVIAALVALGLIILLLSWLF